MIPLTEERKEQLINEHPVGLWIVLNEETPQDRATADDLLSSDPEPGPTS